MASNHKPKLVLYWIRRDFRTIDNPALFHALEESRKTNSNFLPIFILDSSILEKNTNIGYPRRYLLSKILANFAFEFDKFLIFAGNTSDIFENLSQIYELELFFNDDIEPYARQRDSKIQELVRSSGGKVSIFQDQMVLNPELIKTGGGGLYSVFTPFKNNIWGEFTNSKLTPEANFDKIHYLQDIPKMKFKQISFNPKVDYENEQNLQKRIFELIDIPWICNIKKDFELNLDEIIERPNLDNWYVNGNHALQRFTSFLDNDLDLYKTSRDMLAEDGTSKMSLALKWGLVSPRILVQLILQSGELNESRISYVSELIWREFYKYILYHSPQVMDQEYNQRFSGQPGSSLWIKDEIAKERFIYWIKGQTGFDIVDAAMHQIHKTGWMHNRARMIVGSFLSKNLGVDWRWGQNFFRSLLVDLDEASNNGGWQWSASVGADPKPIRIFNPFIQAEKFDPKGEYRQFWLPSDYLPYPIVDYKTSREQAILRYKIK